jgi:hypothetical protein
MPCVRLEIIFMIWRLINTFIIIIIILNADALAAAATADDDDDDDDDDEKDDDDEDADDYDVAAAAAAAADDDDDDDTDLVKWSSPVLSAVMTRQSCTNSSSSRSLSNNAAVSAVDKNTSEVRPEVKFKVTAKVNAINCVVKVTDDAMVTVIVSLELSPHNSEIHSHAGA